MSLKQLAAGSGCEYLTRQVAMQDALLPAGGLSSYYTERGEAPGPGRVPGWKHSGSGPVTVHDHGEDAYDVLTRASMTDCRQLIDPLPPSSGASSVTTPPEKAGPQ